MAKKEKMIQELNDLKNPYNLQVNFGAPLIQNGVITEYNCNVNLTLMDEIKVVDGKSVQATHRIVQTSGVGTTRDEAKKNAITEALQFAGVI